MLKVGQTIPNLSLYSDSGEKVILKEKTNGRYSVIYFYPKNETPVCTKEACTFRDRYEVFSDLGIQVIGISADSVKSHEQFKKRHKLPFTLLSDPDKLAHKAFGVAIGPLGFLHSRITFVVDPKNEIQYTFDSLLSSEKHVEESLLYIRKRIGS